jgi:hypothetical protein
MKVRVVIYGDSCRYSALREPGVRNIEALFRHYAAGMVIVNMQSGIKPRNSRTYYNNVKFKMIFNNRISVKRVSHKVSSSRQKTGKRIRRAFVNLL